MLLLEPFCPNILKLLPFVLDIFDENVEIRMCLDVKFAAEKKVTCMGLSHLCVTYRSTYISCLVDHVMQKLRIPAF